MAGGGGRESAHLNKSLNLLERWGIGTLESWIFCG